MRLVIFLVLLIFQTLSLLIKIIKGYKNTMVNLINMKNYLCYWAAIPLLILTQCTRPNKSEEEACVSAYYGEQQLCLASIIKYDHCKLKNCISSNKKQQFNAEHKKRCIASGGGVMLVSHDITSCEEVCNNEIYCSEPYTLVTKNPKDWGEIKNVVHSDTEIFFEFSSIVTFYVKTCKMPTVEILKKEGDGWSEVFNHPSQIHPRSAYYLDGVFFPKKLQNIDLGCDLFTIDKASEEYKLSLITFKRESDHTVENEGSIETYPSYVTSRLKGEVIIRLNLYEKSDENPVTFENNIFL